MGLRESLVYGNRARLMMAELGIDHERAQVLWETLCSAGYYKCLEDQQDVNVAKEQAIRDVFEKMPVTPSVRGVN